MQFSLKAGSFIIQNKSSSPLTDTIFILKYRYFGVGSNVQRRGFSFMLPALIGFIVSHWWAVLIILAAVFWRTVIRVFGVLVIPEDKLAIVTKKFRIFGHNTTLPDGHIIALQGEAGTQADTLPPGLHLWFWPWQYGIKMIPFTTVPEGKVGVVEARDGKSIKAGRTFADRVDCDAYQNARAFLEGEGQRGPQLEIIRPGTYRINTDMFDVRIADATVVDNDQVGLVTTNDGAPLISGEIAGPEVAGHHMFQDGQAFINAGGSKGRQAQVLLAGIYYLNPDFVKVEQSDMTSVPIGYVGVVVSYVGTTSPKTERAEGEVNHANIVRKGERGVWDEPLDPGKYAINPYIQKVELVPTTNIVLNWASAKSEAHNLDANLSTITVRSGDGFRFNLDVSQIIHISPDDASRVIARFGNMQNLVTQVLEPLIGNYFRNSAQSADIIKFLKERAEQQKQAKETIIEALRGYAVQAVDTLIGDIVPPEELMKTLTDRKVAEQQTVTYATKQAAEEARTQLEEATAMANTRSKVVDAARAVEVADLNAQAVVKAAGGEAEAKTINAAADARVLELVGDATAKKTLAVGNAEAEVQKAKVESIGAEPYARIQVANTLAQNGIKLVPEILVTGGEGGSGGGLVEAMLGNMLANDRKATPAPAATAPEVALAPAKAEVLAAPAAEEEPT